MPAKTGAQLLKNTKPKRNYGRNMTQAVGISVLLSSFVMIAIYSHPVIFLIFSIVLVCMALWEFKYALLKGGYEINLPPLIISAIGILYASFSIGETFMELFYLLSVIAIFFYSALGDNPHSRLPTISASIFALTYIPFCASFLILILLQPDGSSRLLLAILMPIANDIGGFFAGHRFGKHKFSKISPNKTIEGFVGSVLSCMVVSNVFFFIAFRYIYYTDYFWVPTFFGFIAAFTSTFGDLLESVIKRDLGLKDMGKMLKAHGGLLDRFDSILISAPFSYIILLCFV
ncbi:MAG: phosphatidate cytidylyltransferase [Bifidobacteriaceae bacterium]|nr:phosphatidate cytidylyltransferase [Bifidobacteriaceae bacterium]